MSTDWSPLSATSRSPAPSTATASGSHSWAPATGPPWPTVPHTPVPVTVYMWPAAMDWPNSVVVSRRHDAHPAVGRVGDEEVAGRVHGDARRMIQLAGRRGEPVPVVTRPPGARDRHGAPRPGRPDDLDPLRGRLGHVDVALRVDGHPTRVSHGAGAGARARTRASSEGGDAARPQVQPVSGPGAGGHHQHPAVAGVGDEEVSRLVEGDTPRSTHLTRAHDRPHDGGSARAGARGQPQRRARHQPGEPGERHGGSAHRLIMPSPGRVAPAARHSGRAPDRNGPHCP